MTTDPAIARVPWRGVIVFIVLSSGLAWLLALPLWLDGGLANPLFPVLAAVTMVTPAIAALLVVRFVDRPASIPRDLGLWPLRPIRRLLAYLGLAALVSFAVVALAIPVGALLGVFPADFAGLSAFRESLAELRGDQPLGMPIEAIVALQFAFVIGGGIVNIVPALGEELGWRGYLLPRLMPLGPVRAVLLSGVIWGLWHAPVVLLGYNYPTSPGWQGVLFLCVTCVLMGTIFGWLRLRSNSVWPAALAHGMFNATAGLAPVFLLAGAELDTRAATVLGWSGWIIPAVIATYLLATRRVAPRGLDRLETR